MSKEPLRANGLLFPVEALGNPEAGEVLRAWSINKELVICMNPLSFPNAGIWGMLLVDVARHVSRALANEGQGSVPENMNLILNGFEKELARPTDMGSTQKIHQN